MLEKLGLDEGRLANPGHTSETGLWHRSGGRFDPRCLGLAQDNVRRTRAVQYIW
jgi:hypothetical protein